LDGVANVHLHVSEAGCVAAASSTDNPVIGRSTQTRRVAAAPLGGFYSSVTGLPLFFVACCWPFVYLFAETLETGVVVTVVPDAGHKYLSVKALWRDW